MNYTILYEKPAIKFIRKQPPAQQKRILEAIHQLPAQGDRKALKGRPGTYRLRVDNYRILYTVEESVLVVRVLDAGNRGDIYKS